MATHSELFSIWEGLQGDGGFDPTVALFSANENEAPDVNTSIAVDAEHCLKPQYQGKKEGVAVAAETGDIFRLKSVLHAIRRVNSLILHQKERSTLIQGICDVLVESREYDKVGITLLDEEEEVITSAFAELESNDAWWVEERPVFEDKDALGSVLKQSGVVTLGVRQLDCGNWSVPEAANDHLTLAMRLEYQEQCFGIMVVKAVIAMAENGEERQWLQEMANDIAYAIHNINIEEESAHARRRMERSLREKGVLLKEIHHRVKNNLQIISALISLQANRIDNSAVCEALNDTLHRVRSMALIHEGIYSAHDFSRIDFSLFVLQLTQELKHTYSEQMRQCQVNVDIPSVKLSLERAIPCGLVINELVTNALKHAFPEPAERKGMISIAMRQLAEGEVELVVEDNGIGLPESVDVGTAETCGMVIVQNLVESQLLGSLTIDRCSGTQYTIVFPVENVL